MIFRGEHPFYSMTWWFSEVGTPLLFTMSWWFPDVGPPLYYGRTDSLSTLVLFVVVMRHCVTLQHFHYCIVRFSPIASRSNYFIAIGFSESRKGYFDTLYALDGGKAPRSERPKAKVLINKQVRQSAISVCLFQGFLAMVCLLPDWRFHICRVSPWPWHSSVNFLVV